MEMKQKITRNITFGEKEIRSTIIITKAYLNDVFWKSY